MKKFVLIALAFVFFAAPALADGSVYLTATQPSEVLAGESTFFDATIWNNQSDSDWFSLSLYPSDWTSISEGTTALFVGGYDYKTFRVDVSPPADARGIRYVYTVSAQGQKAGKASVDVVVPVQQRYSGVMISDFSTSCLECKDSVEVQAVVKNVGNADLKDLVVVLSAGQYTKNFDIESLRQGEEKTISTKFLTGQWEPGTYDASAKLSSGAGTDYKTAKFSVVENKFISTTKSSQKNFWGSTVYLTIRNDGNVNDNAEISSEKINDFFVALQPSVKPSSVTGGVLTWYASLAPGEEKTFVYSQVFWPVPFGAVFSILIAIYAYSIATAIEIRKLILGKGNALGISLQIKNKGSDADGVIVRDVVPPNFSVIPLFETVKPIMRKIAEGTELIWRVGNVKKGDERVLHYKIKPNGPVSGALPTAVLRGRRGISYLQKTSNYAVLPRVQGAQPQKLKVVVEE